MSLPEHQPARRYHYGDYAAWPPGERWELIEGRAYAMTPAPGLLHQRLAAALTAVLWQWFEGKTCQVFAAPMDVRLPQGGESDEAVETVLQPDLLVVCDPAKLDEKGVRGAPDLVIEILSESTAVRDLGEKLGLYERHGVRCYLIADPWGKTLTVRYLESGGRYGRPELFTSGDKVAIRLFDGLVLDLDRVYRGL
jgi:Uma2 family endonuclease